MWKSGPLQTKNLEYSILRLKMTFYYYFTMTWMLRGFDIKRLLRRFDSQYKNLQSRIFTVTHKESRIKAALTMSNPIQPQLPRIQMTERYSVATNTFKHTKEQPNPVIFRFAKLIQNPLAWSNSILYVYIYIYISFQRMQFQTSRNSRRPSGKGKRRYTGRPAVVVWPTVAGKKGGRSSEREGREQR